MAFKRRTRKEKEIAKLRRMVEVREGADRLAVTKAVRSETVQPLQKSDDVVRDYYYPEMTMPMNLVKSDLTRTIVVTILALILQFALAAYLARGGSDMVSKILLQKFGNL